MLVRKEGIHEGCRCCGSNSHCCIRYGWWLGSRRVISRVMRGRHPSLGSLPLTDNFTAAIMQAISEQSEMPDDNDSIYDGYFCITTDPFNCSCRYEPWICVHFDNKVVVWEEKDDVSLLRAAAEFQKLNLHPQITEYEWMLGRCIDWKDIPSGALIG